MENVLLLYIHILIYILILCYSFVSLFGFKDPIDYSYKRRNKLGL